MLKVNTHYQVWFSLSSFEEVSVNPILVELSVIGYQFVEQVFSVKWKMETHLPNQVSTFIFLTINFKGRKQSFHQKPITDNRLPTALPFDLVRAQQKRESWHSNR